MTHQVSVFRRLSFVLAAATLPFGASALAEGDISSADSDVEFSLSSNVLSAPLQVAIEDDSLLAGFYAPRGFAPIWLTETGAPTEKGLHLQAAFGAAASHGLPAMRYAEARIAVPEGADPARLARHELVLTRAFLTYARDLTSGLLEPRKVDREIYTKPLRPDQAVLLNGAATAVDFEAFLAALAPAGRDYASLRAELARLRAAGQLPDWGARVPAGPSLKPGKVSPRVPVLRDRLMATGDLDPAAMADAVPERLAANDVTSDAPQAPVPAVDPMFFDAALVAAVERFQTRHGLNADGIVGPATLAAINTSPETRMQQILVNLERMRWLNRDLGQRHVMVNLAGYTMAFIEDGKPRLTSRVVVGKARKHQTPEFSDELEHIVVNPTWNVPHSIATKEILPILRENPNYLAEKNMVLRGTDADPASIDWSTVTRGTFPGRIMQRSGAGNALGQVKFLFPNDFAIYLHDTQSRSLFAKDRRAYSHGCVRVEKPVEFAHLLLSLQVDDPVGTYQAYRDSGRERWVNLERKIPVHLTYRTAWIDETGRHQFREDIYGRDARIFAALDAMGVAALN